ncbi:hypothetical protein KKF61_03125 [Patescibacteria group bacterium]|nr:hypothetical protein [Patescibacteria group bacterium]MBU0964004.1 hypothetical protein [Patescibacteria group bacterium]
MQGKKILIIIAFIVVIIGFGALIYFVFIRDLVTPTNDTNVNEVSNENVNGTLPVINTVTNTDVTPPVNEGPIINTTTFRNVNGVNVDTVARGGPTEVSSVTTTRVQAAEPVVSGDGVRYYDKNIGKFFELSPGGDAQEMSEEVFPEVEDISWSPVDNQAILSFPDNSNILFNFDTQEQVTLPKEWDDIDFSPTGSKIGFKNLSSEERARWLAISNPDGSEVQLIEPIGDKTNDVAVEWSPNGQVVALYRENVSGTSQEAYFVGIHGENFKSVVTQGRGFEGKWSPSGEQMIYTVYSADTRYNPVLHIVDAAGDQIGSNNLNLGVQTWVARCAFSNSSPNLYCAVPDYLPTGSGLYPESIDNTNDSIYLLDTNSGQKRIIALPTFFDRSQDYSIASVFLSNDENELYFIENNSGRIYSIQLK